MSRRPHSVSDTKLVCERIQLFAVKYRIAHFKGNHYDAIQHNTQRYTKRGFRYWVALGAYFRPPTANYKLAGHASS